jgi:hypothetical protein
LISWPHCLQINAVGKMPCLGNERVRIAIGQAPQRSQVINRFSGFPAMLNWVNRARGINDIPAAISSNAIPALT